jgi:transposase
MSKEKSTLTRFHVGGLPLIRDIADRMDLRAIMYRHIGAHGNETIPAVESLMLLIFNLTLGKEPLYQLEDWVASLDGKCLGYEVLQKVRFNDDRFGRGLDKLFECDRASLMTELVVKVVEEFDVQLDRIHNDSTTVKAYGRIPGKTKTGLELKRGKSKDHRPDLRQLLFSLSISSDGAVPVHQKSYPGNTPDDKTHIDTWKVIRAVNDGPGFLYVADSKLCTDEQLHYITGQGGRAITIIPETWAEVGSFKNSLRETRKRKKEIWRRLKPGSDDEMEYFSAFSGRFLTEKRGYRIHWIYSSEKRKRDRISRENRLKKAEMKIADLTAKINKRNLKTEVEIRAAVTKILEDEKVDKFLHCGIGTAREDSRIQIGKGRPGKKTKYSERIETFHTLSWARKDMALKAEAHTDGVFPLLCTDGRLSSKKVLQAYKYQPRLEKRFSQFKSVHKAAPLLFKKIERVEANMFAFFVALMIQALIERQVRQEMPAHRIVSLNLYPEGRHAPHPTTAKILNLFDGVSTYRIARESELDEEFKDDLSTTQKTILKLMHMRENDFWKAEKVKF